MEFTLNRLRKRYSEEDSENMFFEDDIYATFLADMRALLQDDVAFKNRYCEVNNISKNDRISGTKLSVFAESAQTQMQA